MSTIHLTNWSARKLHGPGRKLTIMTRPRTWEHGEGRVQLLCPSGSALRKAQEGIIDITEYRRRYLASLEKPLAEGLLAPGRLSFLPIDVAMTSPAVSDGDTLCCACSLSHAAAGKCHRVFAAKALKDAGWTVKLDGRTFDSLDPEGVPIFAHSAAARVVLNLFGDES